MRRDRLLFNGFVRENEWGPATALLSHNPMLLLKAPPRNEDSASCSRLLRCDNLMASCC